jgi:hypothetical protein
MGIVATTGDEAAGAVLNLHACARTTRPSFDVERFRGIEHHKPIVDQRGVPAPS